MVIVQEKDGSYSRILNGKKYTVSANDSRYNNIASEYKQQDSTASGIKSAIAAQQADRTGTRNQPTAAGTGTLSIGENGSDIIRTVGNKQYVTSKGDDRYGAMTAEYYDQQGIGAGTPSSGYQGIRSMNTMGGGSGPSGYDAYANILRQSLERQLAANNAAVDAAVGELNAGKDRANQGYDNMANQAYIAMMQSKKQMPQEMAALGLMGTGMSESTAMGNMMNYQNNLNTNEQERLNTLNDYAVRIAQERAAAGQTNAALEASTNQQMADAYLNLYLQEQQRQAQEQAYERELEAQRVAYEREDANIQRQLLAERINMLLNLGMATPEMAAYLGVDQASLQRMLNSIYSA